MADDKHFFITMVIAGSLMLGFGIDGGIENILSVGTCIGGSALFFSLAQYALFRRFFAQRE